VNYNNYKDNNNNNYNNNNLVIKLKVLVLSHLPKKLN